MELVTVRIPELVGHPGPLSLDDKLPIWHAALNKTRQTSLNEIRDLILTGGAGAVLPVVQAGDTIIHIVTAAEDGSNIVSIPALAGKTFKLRKSGQPLLPQTGTTPGPTDEYACLNAGGFELLQPGDKVLEGERYELEVFALQGGNIPGPTTGGGSLVTGQLIVTTNLTMIPADHLNKLISIRADNAIITLTLPDIADVPDNTIVPIETTILNNWQARITTQNGQYIYMLNTNYTSLYMGKSESLWLYRGNDGWYVINDFANNYQQVGKIQASYKIGLNEIYADGSLLSRAAHPRLWQEVQTFGASLVSEAIWQTGSVLVQGRTVFNPYRGCFSTGDGSTSFRVPLLRDMSLRGKKDNTTTDPERHYNHPGGYQRHEFQSHQHHTGPWNKASGRGNEVGGNTPSGIDDNNLSTEYRVGAMTEGEWTDATLIAQGGNETRMDNIAVLWTIKE